MIYVFPLIIFLSFTLISLNTLLISFPKFVVFEIVIFFFHWSLFFYIYPFDGISNYLIYYM